MSSLDETWGHFRHAFIAVVISAVMKFIFDLMDRCTVREKPSALKKDWKRDVDYLYQFPRVKGTANMSPFCLKVEMFLRIHNIEHEIVNTTWRRSAEGKLPFIELNGEHIVDSQLIVELLKRHFNIQARFANLLYHKAGTNTVRFAGVKLEGRAPSFVKYLAYPLHSHTIWTYLNMQGTGKHTEKEVIDILRWDLQALDDVLGHKPYLVGDTPTLADCTFFSHIATTYDLPFDQPIKQLLEEEFPRLKALHDRIAKEVFSDIKFLRME
ncbi:Protein CDR-2 [Aphelenchoides avenae]|nr:Protein CDR-2 [Aphelenchus avenae]